MTRSVRSIVSVVLAAAIWSGPALAQAGQPNTWSETKCARYREDWTEALARRKLNSRAVQGLNSDFLDRHEAFLASGCTGPRDVCPRTAAELELANIMVIRAMNAGAASTFLPFACPK